MRFYLTFIFVLIITTADAQYKLKFGKIEDKDVKMTTYEADPDAGAVVLAEDMRVVFGLRNGYPLLTYYYHVRIKVLDKKAFDEGNIEIPYWSYRRGEKINKLKAQTINWENGKIVKTKVEKDAIFKEQKNKYISLNKFAFPNVKEGSVLEYSYQKDSDYFVSVDDYFFQRQIPVIWSQYSVRVLEFLKYRFDVQGKHRFTVQNQKPITMASANGATGTEYQWLMKNIPALKPEPFITSMNDYYSAVRMRLSSFEPTGGFSEKYIGTWPQMNRFYYKEIAKKNFLKDNYSNKVWKVAEPLVQNIEKPLDKVKILYDFVQKNIKWNEIDEIDPEHDADYCFDEKKGSNTEINLTLLALLKKAGIEAYPMLISTRDHQKPMNFLPYMYQFNQTLVVVNINEKSYFIDASHKDYPMQILHPNNLNTEGWIIKTETEGRWLNIPAARSKDILLPKLTLAADGTVTGEIQALHQGYIAQNCRAFLKAESEAIYINQNYLVQNPSAVIENLTFDGLDDNTKKIKEKMDFESSEMSQVTDEMIYFSPFIKPTFTENPFKSENREIPVDMEYGIDNQYILKLTIPEGFIVESLPETAKIILPNNGGVFTLACSQKGQEIAVISKVRIDQTYYKPEEYPILRAFVDLVVNKQAEQIVLKRK